jgi:catechol 2,3-dioxygenase
MSPREARGDAHGIAPPSFRLPAAAHPGRVRLQVSDLARSLEYYRETIGLHVCAGSNGFAALGDADLGTLVELHENRGAARVPRHGLLGLYHFAILVPDRSALGRFLVHLASRRVPIASADHAVSEALYLWDPDGLGIEVYADRPRSTWRHRKGELYMTTEPLDTSAVIAAAQGERWTGMPSGTRMGHVLLHVGGLAEAEAFYHVGLGFDRTVWSYPGALFLSAGGYHHHLGTNVWAAGARPAGPEDARLIDWELALPSATDVDEAVASLGRAGHAARRDGPDALVSDPWGTTLRLTTASR